MSGIEPESLAALLTAATAGDERAAERLFPLVYDELHRLAGHYLGGQRPGHTLQATALVHEAYLKLVGSGSWRDRDHFVAVAATAMRQILVNHAKAKGRLKRGGAAERVALDDLAALTERSGVDVLALDRALTRLGSLDERQARIVELRFFAGLSIDEVARLLDVAPRTVHRDWATARLFLRGELAGSEMDGP